MSAVTVTLRINADGSGAITSLKQVGSAAEQAGSQAARGGKQGAAGIKSTSEAARDASRQVGSLADMVKGLVAGFVGLQTVRGLSAMADTWSDLTSRVRLSIGAYEDAGQVMGRLASIARQTYSEFDLTAEAFARNSVTLRALGKSTQEQLDYTQALNNAIVVSGAKQQQAEMIQNSLAKAMAEGTLRGDELNNVLNYGSRIAELLAENLGTNVTGLRALSAEGKITSDVLFDTLVTNMQRVSEEAESMPATIGDGMVLIRNALLETIGVFDQSGGFSERFAEKLVVIADNMSAIVRWAADIAIGLGVAFGAKTLAMIAMAVQRMGLLAAAMTALGGPLGVITLAITGAVVAWRRWRDATDDVGRAAQETDRIIRELASATGDSRDEAIKATQAARDEASERVELARAALTEAQAKLELAKVTQMLDRDTAGGSAGLGAVGRAAAQIVEAEQRLAAFHRQLGQLDTALITNAGNAAHWYAQLQEATKHVEGPLIKGLVAWAGRLVPVEKAQDRLTQTITQGTEAKDAAAKALRELEAMYQRAGRAAEQLQRIDRELAAEMGGPSVRIAHAYEDAVAGLAQAWEQLTALGPPTIEQIRAFDRAMENAGRRRQLHLADLARERDFMGDIAAQVDARIRGIGLSVHALEAEHIVTDALNRARLAGADITGINTQALIDQTAATLEATAAAQAHYERLEQASADVSSAIVAQWRGDTQSISNLVKRWIDQLIAEFLRLKVVQPLIMGLFGGSGGGLGLGMIGAAGSALMGGGGSIAHGGTQAVTAASGAGTSWGGLMEAGTWARMGKNLFGGFQTAMLGSGQVMPGAGMLGTGVYGPGMQTAWAPTGLGYGLGAAGGLYAGYNRWQNSNGGVMGGLGAAAYGIGTAGLIGGIGGIMGGVGFGAGMAGGLGAGAAAGAGMTGVAAAIPVIGWVALVAMVVDMVAGGKLFGTSYRPESVTQTIGIDDQGGYAAASMTEVRQRSLFRGRQWRESDIDATDEAVDAAHQFWRSVSGAMQAAARQLGVETGQVIEGAFNVQVLFDKKGRETGTEEWGELLGRRWEEEWDQFAQRVVGANILSVIAQALTPDQIGTIDAGWLPGGAGDELGGGEVPGGGKPPRDVGPPLMVKSVLAGVADDIDSGAGMVDVAAQGWSESFAALMTIAERWSATGEEFLAGAQFLLAAASDMVHGIGLLRDEGTLADIADLVEELALEGEGLIDTYARLQAQAGLLDQAVDLMGVNLDISREAFVRLADDITHAVGGLENAQALWGSYFANYYDSVEMTVRQLDQLLAGRDTALAAVDLDPGTTMDEFRQAFEAALPTLSAEQIAQWLQAADVLAAATDAQAQYALAVIDHTDNLETILAGVAQALDAAAPGVTDWAGAMADLEQRNAELIATATALGASEEELEQIRAFAALRVAELAAAEQMAADAYADHIDQFRDRSDIERATADIQRQAAEAVEQAEALARAAGLQGAATEDLAEISAWAEREIAALQAELAAAGQAYADYIAQVTDRRPYQSAHDAIMRERDQHISQAHDLARAAGMEGAASADLARIHRRAAGQIAAATLRIRDEITRLVAELSAGGRFVPGQGYVHDPIDEFENHATGAIGRIDDASQRMYQAQLAGIQRIQDYLNSMQFGQLSALSPMEQLDAARTQLELLQTAAMAGDADAMSALPGAAQQYLQLLQGAYASGDEFGAGYEWVQQLLQAVVDQGPTVDPADPTGSGGQGSYPGLTPAGLRERDELLAQQEAEYRAALAMDLATHLGQLAELVNAPVLELAGLLGVSLESLVADLGINLQDITGNAVLALADLADALGLSLGGLAGELGLELADLGGGITELLDRMGHSLDAITAETVTAMVGLGQMLGMSLGEITQALGLELTDLADGLTELTEGVGIDLGNLTTQSVAALAQLATDLGIDLGDLATAVGAEIGELTDSQSLLNQTFATQLANLPEHERDALQPLFDAVTTATSDADANAAIQELEDAVNGIGGAAADALAPYLAGVFPAAALTDLDYLGGIDTTARAMKSVLDNQLSSLNSVSSSTSAMSNTLDRVRNLLRAQNADAGLPTYASGGWVNARTTLVAGEAGRELILPNAVSEFFAREGIPFNAPAGGDPQLLAELRQLRAETAQLRAAVVDADHNNQLVTTTTGREGATQLSEALRGTTIHRGMRSHG